MQNFLRTDGRAFCDLRLLKATYNVYEYASGSILLELGSTKILCAVTLQQGVPPFLKGKKTGWLTAEYAMLPASTHTRTPRDIQSLKKNGRSIEISRLISRSLRAIALLDQLGERTITIDCDVLQADGSTRVASVIASYLALKAAVATWISQEVVRENFLTDEICALSVGMSQNVPLLDINYEEDSSIDADFNFVLTKSGGIIEMQGTAEKRAVSWQDFEEMKKVVLVGSQKIFSWYATHAEDVNLLNDPKAKRKAPLFSLINRQVSVEL